MAIRHIIYDDTITSQEVEGRFLFLYFYSPIFFFETGRVANLLIILMVHNGL